MEQKTQEFSDEFKKASSLSFSVFGTNAFRKFGTGSPANPSGGWERPINRPLFDVVMWGFTRFDKNQVMAHADGIRAALIKLTTEDNSFIDAITSATGDKNKTQFRFELWHETLKEIITTPTQARAFNIKLKRELFENDNQCAICNQTIHSLDDTHIDHMEAFSKGGSTDASNAQITHRYCNLRKSSN